MKERVVTQLILATIFSLVKHPYVLLLCMMCPPNIHMHKVNNLHQNCDSHRAGICQIATYLPIIHYHLYITVVQFTQAHPQ